MTEELEEMAVLLGLGAPAGGAISPVERLLNQFEAHEAKEEKAIEQYRKLLAQLPSPLTRFLMQLIISDEEKHRAVVHAMIATLKGSLLWRKPEGSFEGGGDLAELNGTLAKITEDFIRLEKAGIKEYRALAEDSRGYYHGLFKVLLDAMIRDSEKHVELLEFLRDSLKGT
ncbi:MAG TPA: ferritin-like domain-containing protein [Candidatus Eisenbacteria bacterium]|nr:ferritin-like domain-containing protein [Candidatus Eisenbacteria bacterium]